jgi:hypothetical protein
MRKRARESERERERGGEREREREREKERARATLICSPPAVCSIQQPANQLRTFGIESVDFNQLGLPAAKFDDCHWTNLAKIKLGISCVSTRATVLGVQRREIGSMMGDAC